MALGMTTCPDRQRDRCSDGLVLPRGSSTRIRSQWTAGTRKHTKMHTGIRICEQGGERQHDFEEGKRRRPVLLENIDTDSTLVRYVHVINPVLLIDHSRGTELSTYRVENETFGAENLKTDELDLLGGC